MASLVQVLTTIDSAEAAQALADALVGERLAACVQVIGPIASTYWWKGRVARSSEWLCVAKTTPARSAQLMARLRVLHSYELPEVLVTPVAEADPSYAAWVAAEVGDQPV